MYICMYTCTYVCVGMYVSNYLLHGAADQFSGSLEILCILWNPKVYYCSHKCPLPVPILSQFIPPHPTCRRSILILSSHLSLSLPSVVIISTIYISALVYLRLRLVPKNSEWPTVWLWGVQRWIFGFNEKTHRNYWKKQDSTLGHVTRAKSWIDCLHVKLYSSYFSWSSAFRYMSLQSYKHSVHTNVGADNRTTLAGDMRFGMGDGEKGKVEQSKVYPRKVCEGPQGRRRIALLFL